MHRARQAVCGFFPAGRVVCCIGLRVLQRRSKGYNKAPLAGRSFDDPEDDDADEEEERHDASMAGSPLTRRS